MCRLNARNITGNKRYSVFNIRNILIFYIFGKPNLTKNKPMKKNHLIFVISILFSTISFSQIIQFQKTYNFGTDDNASDILETPDGGFFIVGKTGTEANNETILILRLNEAGDTLWSKIFASDTTSFAQKIIQTSDGNYLIAGGLNDNSFLLKINGEGDSLWSKSFPGEYKTAFKDMVELPNSDLILINWIYFTPINSHIIKMDSEGNIDWTTTGNWEECNSIKLCSENEFLLSGWQGSVFDPTVYLLKYDLSGNLIFHKQFTEYHGQNRCLDISGQSVFLGGFKDSGTIPSIIKTNIEGNTENWYDLVNTQSKIIEAVVVDNNNHIMTCSTDWWETFFITGLNTEGEIIGEVEIEMTFPSTTSCININNSLYVTGKFASENDGWDIFLVKLNIDSLFVETKIKDYPVTSEPLIFPNPAKDKVFVEIPSGSFDQDIEFELKNSTGQKILTPISTQGNVFTVSVNGLDKGIYFVSIYSPNHPVVTKKIVVVH
jgi:hypothetical protein